MKQPNITRVFLIGWDGAGSFIRSALTPRLDNLTANGILSLDARTVSPTISAQCWGSLLHGVSPDKHGLTNDKASWQPYPGDSPYPSIFGVVRESLPEAKLASFSSWSPINDGIIESDIGVHKETAELPEMAEEEAGGDSSLSRLAKKERSLALAAASYVRSNPDVKLMFVQFDLPDAAGHQDGYNTPGQIRAIEQTDAHTGILLDAIQAAGLMEDSLFIFASDHGGGGADPFDHGSDHPLDTTIFWGCAGPGIFPGATLDADFILTDTAAVVVHALGLDAPSTWEAKLPFRIGL
ncbi:Type I phosphodiesterase / nucleotide pyrophosphatase [Paenibacillus sp. UNCCL117]|uniref:alkaline phosphatase family protein n=1 Tax=unclassified Paenibacillus TaxID=185978 RepID=UPI0008866298|nr:MULTISPECIES: alkaline phosphatase family protein [unclassified Paenibacillus]SDD18087.1 Type I phosphodiesterase / nucleotide pyrophosphatase [Paenibacillus sp. cl123]SFW35140.1 Type I phosphodiesterase / nucleotide pyrophosphatase [Paenibacillus sp. UNCCL117]